MAQMNSEDKARPLASSCGYLTPSKNIPLSPGLGAGFAEDGFGSLTDNHGNILIGHELIAVKDGEARYYDLTDDQWKQLVRMIAPHATAADNQMRRDNIISILHNEESPLEVTLRELEVAGARYTPIIAKSTNSKLIQK
jgi:hypothetical protein